MNGGMVPLLLVHGYPFDHSLWDGVVGFLREEFECHAPDLPGFGANPTPRAEPSLDLYADFLAGYMEGLGIQRAVVAGMSMGGYVALAFAERHPARLAGLGLVSTHPFADTDETRAARRAMAERVRAEGPMAAARAAFPKLFSPARQGAADLEMVPTRAAEAAGVGGITYALEAMAARPSRRPLLDSLGLPILIAHGVEDQLVPIERARALAEELSGAKLVSVERAGHVLPLEAPGILSAALGALVHASESAIPGDPTSIAFTRFIDRPH